MATRFDDWGGRFFQHHGVKGQKWGIRRYQNPDGSLTEAGKKRVAKSGGYMNPNYRQRDGLRRGGMSTYERTEVRAKYNDEWDSNYYSKGRPHSGGWNYKEEKKLWDKYKDRYAQATLKDLRLADTQKGRDAVKAIFKELDPDYKFHK